MSIFKEEELEEELEEESGDEELNEEDDEGGNESVALNETRFASNSFKRMIGRF